MGSAMFFSGTGLTDSQIKARLDLSVGVVGDANPSGLGDAFQLRGDIDPVTREIAVALLNHVAEMDTARITLSFVALFLGPGRLQRTTASPDGRTRAPKYCHVRPNRVRQRSAGFTGLTPRCPLFVAS
jgi:hypothetical protein